MDPNKREKSCLGEIFLQNQGEINQQIKAALRISTVGSGDFQEQASKPLGGLKRNFQQVGLEAPELDFKV